MSEPEAIDRVVASNRKPATPGPWHLEARGRGIPVFAVYGQNDEHVAKVDGGENARLIVAAPELLAALKAAVAGIESVDELVGIVAAGDFGTRETDARAAELEGMLMLMAAEIHTLIGRIEA